MINETVLGEKFVDTDVYIPPLLRISYLNINSVELNLKAQHTKLPW